MDIKYKYVQDEIIKNEIKLKKMKLNKHSLVLTQWW